MVGEVVARPAGEEPEHHRHCRLLYHFRGQPSLQADLALLPTLQLMLLCLVMALLRTTAVLMPTQRGVVGDQERWCMGVPVRPGAPQLPFPI